MVIQKKFRYFKKIYRTDLNESIEFKLNKNDYKIGTCNPQEGIIYER